MKKYSLIILIGLLFFCFGFSPHLGVIARKNAGGVGTIGHLTDDGTRELQGGYMYHYKFQPTVAGNISYAHILSFDGDGETACLSLHSADGTKLLSATVVLTDGVNAWFNVSLGGTYEVQAATDYYLAIQLTGGGGFIREDSVVSSNGWWWQDTYECGQAIGTTEDNVHIADKLLTIYFDNQSGDPS